MDKKEKYHHYIQAIIREYGQKGTSYEDVQTEFIFDTNGDHYQLVRAGWQEDRRIYGCLIHMDIINNKIWIQYNRTEVDFAEKLVALGVPKEDLF